MLQTLTDIARALLFMLFGGTIGIFLIFASAAFIPKLLNRITPNLDETREIAEGNRAVAEYFGRIVQACILGISIVIAAAVVAGLFIALY